MVFLGSGDCVSASEFFMDECFLMLWQGCKGGILCLSLWVQQNYGLM